MQIHYVFMLFSEVLFKIYGCKSVIQLIHEIKYNSISKSFFLKIIMLLVKSFNIMCFSHLNILNTWLNDSIYDKENMLVKRDKS